MLRVVSYYFIIHFFLFPTIKVLAQNYTERNSITVTDEGKNILSSPWAGGLNACQFGNIDLNLDGVEDLLVLERHGNRLMPFVRQEGSENFMLETTLLEHIPPLHDWMIIRDFDQDGNPDIFTYSDEPGGMMVYRNVSTKELKFELIVYPHLLSFQGSGYTNILVTDVDYPGIEDIDGDGDLDILTFRVYGSWVEMHQNMSVENYGHSDSLIYERTTMCWGSFSESDESNEINLDTCFYKTNNFPEKGERHTGSTFFINDFDNDSDMDLLLGDFDYPNLVLMENGGSQEEALIISYTENFPENKPIELFSMPLAFMCDINLDGVEDMLVSVFDPRIETADNHGTVWYYQGNIKGNELTFDFVSTSFLQDQMLDFGAGAYPSLVDYNADGLMDIVIGNFGYHQYSWFDENQFLHSKYTSQLALLENTGTLNNPAFHLLNSDYKALSELDLLSLTPCFGDIDGDSDIDMLVGNADGTIIYFENIAGQDQPIELAAPVFNYFDIDVGDIGSEELGYSSPQLFDIDQDGILDLIIGEINGTINYYKNMGSTTVPDFELITDYFGEVNVTDPNVSLYGYSTPYFFVNPNGDINLLVGSEQGRVYYYEDIENNLNGVFTESEDFELFTGTTLISIDRGLRSAPATVDLNNDGFMELLVGNFAGGVDYFSLVETPQVEFINENEERSLRIFPNPGAGVFYIESKFSNLTYNLYSSQGYYINNGVLKEKNDFTGLPEGVYFLSIFEKNNRKQYCRKLIIIK